MSNEEKTKALPFYIKAVSDDRIAWIALLFIMVFAGLVRYRLLALPLERDEGEYAYAGQLILQGIPPYSEVCNMKFPGIYAAYAAILAVFGQTHQGIHIGLLLINEITIVLVFLLAKHLLNPLSAAVSAAAFALFSMSQSVGGTSANAEHFVILFAVAGFLVMLRALDKNSLWDFFAAGILMGISLTMKQHGLAFGAIAVFYLVLDVLLQSPVPQRKWLWRELSLISGIMTIVICLCVVMVWTGVFKNFWFWTVDYARTYVSQNSLKQGLNVFVNNSLRVLRSSLLLWAMTGLGVIFLLTGQVTKKQKMFLLLYAVFSFLSICPGFYFRNHYFILLLPCAALLAGTAVYILLKWLSPLAWAYRLIPLLLAAICVVQSTYQQREAFFQMTPFKFCCTFYGENPFQESLEIASYIRNHTAPEDAIVVLGSAPQIYFYARRRCASGYIYMYPLMEANPFALQMQNNFIRNTEAKAPKYLIFVNIPVSWLYIEKSHTLLFEWMKKYCSAEFKLVGTAEMYENETVYRWNSQVQWPLTCEFWVAVFERRQDRPKQDN